MQAAYASPSGEDVRLVLNDGSAWAVKANDPRLAGLTVAPYVAPALPRYRSKFFLYARMTDAELETLADFLANTATTRQRLQWTDALEIDCVDPQIVAFATALFGAPRAVEILAP